MIAAAGMMLASCSTTRKNKTVTKSTVDSTSQIDKKKIDVVKVDSAGTISKKDTSTVTEVGQIVTETETGWDVIKVDSGDVITFPNNPSDADDYFPPGPVITKPGGKKVIYVPIKREKKTEATAKTTSTGSSTDITSKVNRSDSSADQESGTTAVKKTESVKDKQVTKSRPSWLLYFGLLILLLLFLAYRYRKRIKTLIWPASALNNP